MKRQTVFWFTNIVGPLILVSYWRGVQAFEDPSVEMATLAYTALDESELTNPNRVKVVCDRFGRALYFSRAPIPYSADGMVDQTECRIHQGIYGFRRNNLLAFSELPRTQLECTESLEQLRALENGWTLAVVDVVQPCISVDTPADLSTAIAHARAHSKKG